MKKMTFEELKLLIKQYAISRKEPEEHIISEVIGYFTMRDFLISGDFQKLIVSHAKKMGLDLE